MLPTIELFTSHIAVHPSESTTIDILARITTPPKPDNNGPNAFLTIALDISGSMDSENKLENAISASVTSVKNLPLNSVFCMVTFNNSARIMVSPTLIVSEEIRATIISKIKKLQAGGSTNLGKGLQASMKALQMYQESNPVAFQAMVSALWIITDGNPTYGIEDISELVQIVTGEAPMSLEDVPEDIRRGGAGAPTYASVITVGLGSDVNPKLLTALVRNGFYTYIESYSMIETAMNDIMVNLTSFYAKNIVIRFHNDLQMGVAASRIRTMGHENFARNERCKIQVKGQWNWGRTYDFLVSYKASKVHDDENKNKSAVVKVEVEYTVNGESVADSHNGFHLMGYTSNQTVAANSPSQSLSKSIFITRSETASSSCNGPSTEVVIAKLQCKWNHLLIEISTEEDCNKAKAKISEFYKKLLDKHDDLRNNLKFNNLVNSCMEVLDRTKDQTIYGSAGKCYIMSSCSSAPSQNSMGAYC
jgi:hypothetical protein